MAKPTPTKEDQPFIYQLGKDVAKLGFEIEKLKNKSIKAVRIVVPAKPEKYQQYELEAVINLPPECQHAICIQSKRGQVNLVETGETLSVYAESSVSEFYLAPIYKLEAETINAAFNQEQMNDIDAAEREKAEREKAEREKAEREKAEREKSEREKAEREKAEREKSEREKSEQELTYKYLAKFLTDNYLELVRNRTRNRELEAQGIMAYVNKNGLKALLDTPFEKNGTDARRDIAVGDYADAKAAMLAEKAKIDAGDVDLSTAQDFTIVQYDYKDDNL